MTASRSFTESAAFVLRFLKRDMRGSWWRFLSFALLLGATLAFLLASQGAVSSIRQHLKESARDLLGADIVVSSKEQIPPLLGKLYGEEYAQEVRLRSMVRSSNGAHLAQVRAVDTEFPLYGEIETVPPKASWRESGGAVLERALMERLGVKVGDSIDVLGQKVTVAAQLVASPGDFSASYVVAPRIYLPRALVPPGSYTARGGLVDYIMYFSVPPAVDAEGTAGLIKKRLDPAMYDVTTANKRAERTGGVVASVGSLASTVSLAAMTMALLAITFAVRFHARGKRATAAVLRATGASRGLISACFFGESVCLALLASLIGVVGGGFALVGLVSAAEAALDVDLQYSFDAYTISAAVACAGFTLLWAAAPSITFLSSTPAASALRSDLEPTRTSVVDISVRSLSGALLLIIAWIVVGGEKSSAILLGGAAAALAVSVVLATVARRIARFLGERTELLPLRLALRNLHRPGNQTIAVTASITLAVAIAAALSVVEATLDSTRSLATEEGKANVFLYELDPADAEKALSLAKSFGGEPVQQLPVVLMRIASVDGEPVSELVDEENLDRTPRWVLTREYWTSYRDYLLGNERIVEGEFYSGDASNEMKVPISMEDRLAERLGISVGSEIEWDVHGLPITSVVTSLRDILWERFERNSFVVFPKGALEAAPQFLFWALAFSNEDSRASFINAVSKELPSVSAIDLALAVDEILKLLESVGVALKSLLFVVLGTAIALVFITAIGAGVERKGEFDLLSRIGMKRTTEHSMIRAEFLILGALGVGGGIALGIGVGWAICHFGLKTEVYFDWRTPLLLTLGGMIVCTAAGRLVVRRAGR